MNAKQLLRSKNINFIEIPHTDSSIKDAQKKYNYFTFPMIIYGDKVVKDGSMGLPSFLKQLGL
jgi:glutaredoxin